MSRKMACVHLLVILPILALVAFVGGCATPQAPQAPKERSWLGQWEYDPHPLIIEVVIDSDPPGAQIYSVQGEPWGTTPVSRSWRYEKNTADYHLPNIGRVEKVSTYTNSSDLQEKYFCMFGELRDTRMCWLQVETEFWSKNGTNEACLIAHPVLNLSFIASKEGYQRRVHTMQCGDLTDYVQGRVKGPCRRTVLLDRTPGSTVPDIDLKIKIRQPQ